MTKTIQTHLAVFFRIVVLTFALAGPNPVSAHSNSCTSHTSCGWIALSYGKGLGICGPGNSVHK